MSAVLVNANGLPGARTRIFSTLWLLMCACGGQAPQQSLSGTEDVRYPLGPPVQRSTAAGPARSQTSAAPPGAPVGNAAYVEPAAGQIADAGDPKLPPSAGLALVHQPLREHFDAFFVNTEGALIAIWKDNNRSWNNLSALSARNFAPPGASVATAHFADEPTLEVFVVDDAGALEVVSFDKSGAWHAPARLTPAGFAPPGAPVAAVYRPGHSRIVVTLVDNEGALAAVERTRQSPWSAPQRISPVGLAPQGTPVAGAYYARYQQFAFFLIDQRGALHSIEQTNDGAWQLGRISGEHFAPKKAPLAVVYQPVHEQLEVFTVDARGLVTVVAKRMNGAWNGPQALSPPGFIDPGAGIAAVHFPPNQQLEVFVVDRNGLLNVIWKANDGAWRPPGQITAQPLLPGAAVAAAFNPLASLLEVITTDVDGVLHLQWKAGVAPRWSPCTFQLAGSPNSANERQIKRGHCSGGRTVPD